MLFLIQHMTDLTSGVETSISTQQTGHLADDERAA